MGTEVLQDWLKFPQNGKKHMVRTATRPIPLSLLFLGPIFRLSLAGQHVLVISNAKIASDLMVSFMVIEHHSPPTHLSKERRSSIYSDRPVSSSCRYSCSEYRLTTSQRFIMASEILTGGLNLAFAPYGDQ